MKKLYSLSIMTLVVTLISCGPKGPQTEKGIIVDASMDNLTIVNAAGDTISFSTIDAEYIAQNGVLLGDSAEIFFVGDLSKEAHLSTTATKLIITSAPRPVAAFVGQWAQPIKGQAGVQGIDLKEDGTAASINMATLVYNSWTLEGDTLRITGQSIGNRQTIDFNQAATFTMPTPDSLVLTIDGHSENFSRMK